MTDRDALLIAIRSAIAAAPNAGAAMTQAVRLLKDAMPHYTWAGIYLIDVDAGGEHFRGRLVLVR